MFLPEPVYSSRALAPVNERNPHPAEPLDIRTQRPCTLLGVLESGGESVALASLCILLVWSVLVRLVQSGE